MSKIKCKQNTEEKVIGLGWRNKRKLLVEFNLRFAMFQELGVRGRELQVEIRAQHIESCENTVHVEGNASYLKSY